MNIKLKSAFLMKGDPGNYVEKNDLAQTSTFYRISSVIQNNNSHIILNLVKIKC